ncbi:hypothetical protein ACFYOC_10270 [Nocardiopsis alba]|uniref:hypothetical protein n=1 Tax=Nocardiopsis alba TaxID=53437 RepID=UPI0033B755CC
MSAPHRIDPGVRAVLSAPRGERFTRHRQSALAQMADDPRVRYRQEHGELPHWMKVASRRHDQREVRPVPSPRPAPDDVPPTGPSSPPTRLGRHRRPKRPGWRLLAYGLAVVGGALAHHVSTLLL